MRREASVHSLHYIIIKINKKYILYQAQCFESTRQMEMEN